MESPIRGFFRTVMTDATLSGVTVFRPYFMLRGFEHLPLAWDVPA